MGRGLLLYDLGCVLGMQGVQKEERAGRERQKEMMLSDRELDEVTRELGLNEEQVALRKAFLQLGDEDAAQLRSLHELLDSQTQGFTDEFYNHLLRFADLHPFFSDPEAIVRLKRAQMRYFRTMTEGKYGMAYVRDRLRVGVVHQRVQLDIKWYIGAYRKYLSEMMAIMWGKLGDDPDQFFSAFNALLKIVCFDMGLAVDTYANADTQSIIQHQKFVEHIFDSLPSGMLVIDTDYRIQSINPVMKDILGLPRDTQPEGLQLTQWINDPVMMEHIGKVFETGVSQHRLRFPGSRGANTGDALQYSLRRTELDKTYLLLLIVRPVEEQGFTGQGKSGEGALFRMLFNHSPVGMAHLDEAGRFLRVNNKLQQILGYSDNELLEKDWRQITYREDIESEMMYRLSRGEIPDYSCEKRLFHRDGHTLWTNVTVSSVEYQGTKIFIAVIEDISVRKKVEEHVLHMASHDALTNLPNRVLLQDRLSQAIIRAQRSRSNVAILFADMDRFKNINDSLGHDIGDRVIMETAMRMQSALRAGDTVARHGGDEFVIVLNDVKRQADVVQVAEKIISAMAEPIVVPGYELYVSVSIGISMYPRDGKNTATLLKNADTAMYQAKGAGPGVYRFYLDEMNNSSLERLKLEGALRHALERCEFSLHYQPQVDIDSARIVGFEALLRWQMDGVPVSPDKFISVAEETGLIVPIGEWVLQTACAQLQQWREAGYGDDLKMSVNLSARQFRQQDLVKMVRRILSETGSKPNHLVLEITESVVMEAPEAAADVLRQINDMGVRLAIDDFGTGYSSLSYLKRFPIHTVKIDKSFIRDINVDVDDAEIVKAVIALSHAMKRNIVAEGVETDEQLAFLRQHGCDQIQGYYFGRPLDGASTTVLLEAGRNLEPAVTLS